MPNYEVHWQYCETVPDKNHLLSTICTPSKYVKCKKTQIREWETYDRE